MNDSSPTNHRTVIAAMGAAALLAAIGGFLYFKQQRPGDANRAADAAIAAAGMSGAERKATEAVVRAYILDHPEILTEAAEILQRRETVKRLETVGSALSTAFPGAQSGNPKGDVTLIEFTDYSCGFCRASVADVQKLLRSDKSIRVVYREVPILAPASKTAAQWALAAAKQGKHQAFHDAMFAGAKPNEESIRLAAQKAGLDMVRAAKDANSEEVQAELASNLSMMQQIGFNGTPTFIIGDTILEGALGHDALKDAVTKARESS